MCQKNNKDASEVWIKMKPEFKEEVSDKIRTFKFPGQGQTLQPAVYKAISSCENILQVHCMANPLTQLLASFVSGLEKRLEKSKAPADNEPALADEAAARKKQRTTVTPVQELRRLLQDLNAPVSIDQLQTLLEPDLKKMSSKNYIEFRQELGFSIPSKVFSDKLLGLCEEPVVVLEIGCGSGLYARMFAETVKSRGGDWIATDHPETSRKYADHCQVYGDIKMTKDPLALLPEVSGKQQVLLAVWPEPNSDYMLEYIANFKGRFIIIVGEAGVCAHMRVYNHLTKLYGLDDPLLCFYEIMWGDGVYDSMHVWDKEAPGDADLACRYV